MAVAVITGSTRGIGLGLAREFLKRGHNVIVSSRSQAAIDKVIASLNTNIHGKARAVGQQCDVSDLALVQALWDKAVQEFGKVDYWINNAGIIHSYLKFAELPPRDIASVVRINLAGVMHGTQVATAGMKLQESGGWIYNMEGFGSDGMIREGLGLYGTTKRAMTYFTACAVKELRDTPVNVGYIQPGIVMTDLGIGSTKDLPHEERRQKKFLMLLGDTVEDVASYVVTKVLTNKKHGIRIAWLTLPKIIWRMITQLFVKRDPMTPAGY